MKAARMQKKQEFLKKWITGLQIYTNFKNEIMTISERKIAIKLSADDRASKVVVERMIGRRIMEKNKAFTITCSTRIMTRRSRLAAQRQLHQKKARGSVRTSFKASCIAKQLVKKRTRVLKRLVPGGERMDEICLIKETLDYIASLQIQVDVMRNLAAVAERLDPPEKLF